MAYNEAQKAVAVEIIKRHGSVTKHAIEEIQQALGQKVSRSTIFAWYSESSPENRTVQKKQTESETPALVNTQAVAARKLDEMFEDIARKYLQAATQPERMLEMDGKALVTAAAIATDKMRLLRDLPTEIVSVLPSFINTLQKHGVNPFDFLTETIRELNNTTVH